MSLLGRMVSSLRGGVFTPCDFRLCLAVGNLFSQALGDLSHSDLQALVPELPCEGASPKRTTAEQCDAVARLKGLKGRPAIKLGKLGKPGGMDEASKQNACTDGAGRAGAAARSNTHRAALLIVLSQPRFRRAQASRSILFSRSGPGIAAFGDPVPA